MKTLEVQKPATDHTTISGHKASIKKLHVIMRLLFLLITMVASFSLQAQSFDTLQETPSLIVHRDMRLDLLRIKLTEANTADKKSKARSAMGFRLQVLSTNDREYAMKVRSQLLANYPEQKTYMFYQSPYVKLRFGNFKTKPEAELYRKQVSRMLAGTSIYIVAERIEVRPEDIEAE